MSGSDSEEYTLPRKVAKRRATPTKTLKTDISNRFNPISDCTGGEQDMETDKATEPTNARKPVTAKQRIPPITLRNRENWMETVAELSQRDLDFTMAKNVDQGMCIKPASVDAYRKMITYFDEAKLPYHTYVLTEDKPLKVILRDKHVEISESDVKACLANQGFDALSVTRFRRGAERTPIPLVMVQLKKTADNKKIFDVKDALRVRISVESPRAKTAVRQCQQFGHAERLCRAAPKWENYGDDHSSATCTQAHTVPAKCAATAPAANLSISNADPKKEAAARRTEANLAVVGRVDWRNLIPVVLGIMADLSDVSSSGDVVAVILSYAQDIANVFATVN